MTNTMANIEKCIKVLEDCRHAFVFLHGYVATDRPDLFDTDMHKNVCLTVDNANEIAEIESLLSDLRK